MEHESYYYKWNKITSLLCSRELLLANGNWQLAREGNWYGLGMQHNTPPEDDPAGTPRTDAAVDVRGRDG